MHKADMAESGAIQMAIMEAAIQTARAAVMALREADAGPPSGARTANVGEVHRPRHGGQALREQSFKWKAQDKYA